MKPGPPMHQAFLSDCLRTAFPVPEDGEFESLLARFRSEPARTNARASGMLAKLFGSQPPRG
jgi:hypothetical protein